MPKSLAQLTAKAPHRGDKLDWYRIDNKKNDGPAEVYIYGEIGASWWDDDATSAQSFADELKGISASEITIHLNSPGGRIFDGLAIYNTLKQHSASITVIVDALAASAASFIAMAADPGKLVMARNAVMMIHDGSGVAIGNAKDMIDMANLLDKLSDNIADIYTQRAGANVEFWRAAMREETWYTGTEAVTAGLADTVLENADEEAEKVAASWDLSIFNYAGRDRAPAPSVIHNRIKSMMNQAKEATVGKPATPTAHTEGEGESTPVEGAPTEEVVTDQPDEDAPEEEVTGADGDGKPVTGHQPPAEGTQTENRGTAFSVLVNGVQVSDPRAIQAHITALETSQTEARDGARKAFVNSLVTNNKLPATQLTATEEFALELSDTQYEKWTAQWTNAASLSLLGEHGGGSTNHDGKGSLSNEDTQIDTLKDIVKHHKQGGRTEEFIKNTVSYKTLIALQPDFKL